MASGGDKRPLNIGTMVADFVRVALGELGITPVGRMGAKVWRELLSVQTADGEVAGIDADEWTRLRRDCTVGEASLGGLLDFAEAWAKGDARADKGLRVVRVEIGGVGCVVICRTPAAVEAVCRLGAGEVLGGKERYRVLRDQ